MNKSSRFTETQVTGIGVMLLVLMDLGMTRKDFNKITKKKWMQVWDFLEESEKQKSPFQTKEQLNVRCIHYSRKR